MRYLGRLTLVTTITLIFTQALADTALPDQVVLATHELPPYGSTGYDGKFDGVAYRPTSCALENMDIELELLIRPWHRAQLDVKQGKADGFFAASQNPERDQYATHSAFLADQKWQWYWLRKNKLDPTSDSFKANAAVNSFKGANMQRWLEENGYKTEAPPKDSESLLKMLELERLDAILANNYVMDNLIKRNGLQGKVTSAVLKSKPLFAYFNNDFLSAHPSFLDEFNKHLEACQKTVQ